MQIKDKVTVSGLDGVYVVATLDASGSATVRPNRRGRPKFTTVSVSDLTLVPVAVGEDSATQAA